MAWKNAGGGQTNSSQDERMGDHLYEKQLGGKVDDKPLAPNLKRIHDTCDLAFAELKMIPASDERIGGFSEGKPAFSGTWPVPSRRYVKRMAETDQRVGFLLGKHDLFAPSLDSFKELERAETEGNPYTLMMVEFLGSGDTPRLFERCKSISEKMRGFSRELSDHFNIPFERSRKLVGSVLWHATLTGLGRLEYDPGQVDGRIGEFSQYEKMPNALANVYNHHMGVMGELRQKNPQLIQAISHFMGLGVMAAWADIDMIPSESNYTGDPLHSKAMNELIGRQKENLTKGFLSGKPFKDLLRQYEEDQKPINERISGRDSTVLANVPRIIGETAGESKKSRILLPYGSGHTELVERTIDEPGWKNIEVTSIRGAGAMYCRQEENPLQGMLLPLFLSLHGSHQMVRSLGTERFSDFYGNVLPRIHRIKEDDLGLLDLQNQGLKGEQRVNNLVGILFGENHL